MHAAQRFSLTLSLSKGDRKSFFDGVVAPMRTAGQPTGLRPPKTASSHALK